MRNTPKINPYMLKKPKIRSFVSKKFLYSLAVSVLLAGSLTACTSEPDSTPVNSSQSENQYPPDQGDEQGTEDNQSSTEGNNSTDNDGSNNGPDLEEQPKIIELIVPHTEAAAVYPGHTYKVEDILWKSEAGQIDSARIDELIFSVEYDEAAEEANSDEKPDGDQPESDQAVPAQVSAEHVTVHADGTFEVAENATIGLAFNVLVQYEELEAKIPHIIKYSLEDTLENPADELPVVTNPKHTVVVVNKQRKLPDGFAPDDLVEPDVRFSFSEPHEKRQLRKQAAKALEELFSLADKDGIDLFAVSGYRSYARQQYLFQSYIDQQGEEYARRYSAFPGTSEHQTGLTMDVSSSSVGYDLVDSFGNTPEGKWLAKNAHKAGFIIRYPEGKEEITGYAYEPWHLRYVGTELAELIYEQNLTLEEFFNEAIPVHTDTSESNNKVSYNIAR